MTSRRSALKALIALFAAACDSMGAGLRVRKLTRVTSVDSLPPGGAFRMTLPPLPSDSADAYGRPIIVVNDAGTLRAFHAVCTHEGCPLGWNPAQHLIRCPCHGSAFDTKGGVVNGPAARPLTAIDVVVSDGAILIADSPTGGQP